LAAGQVVVDAKPAVAVADRDAELASFCTYGNRQSLAGGTSVKNGVGG